MTELTIMKKNRFAALCFLLVFSLLFFSCNTPISWDPEQLNDKEWVEKFFNFDFQGDEQIELVIEDSFYSAKITLPKENLDSFMRSISKLVKRDHAEISQDYSWFASAYLDWYPQNINKHITASESNFDYMISFFSTPSGGDIDDCDCLRDHVVVVLNSVGEEVTIFAIANFIYYR